MGKVTGFMEYERIEEGYKPVAERVKHYKEFVIGLDDAQANKQAARCMDCGTPFCNNGCPVNNIIPDFNDMVFRDDWKSAIEVARGLETVAAGSFSQRIAHYDCELALEAGPLASEGCLDVGLVERVDIAPDDLDDLSADHVLGPLGGPVAERPVDEAVALPPVDVRQRQAERQMAQKSTEAGGREPVPKVTVLS